MSWERITSMFEASNLSYWSKPLYAEHRNWPSSEKVKRTGLTMLYGEEKNILYCTHPNCCAQRCKMAISVPIMMGQVSVKNLHKIAGFNSPKWTDLLFMNWTGKNNVYFKNGEYENDVLQTIKIHLCAVDLAATCVWKRIN